MKLNVYAFLPGVIWFVITVILFTIPGDQLPKEELFGTPNLDKLVHTFLFFLLCYLFCRPLRLEEDIYRKKSFFVKTALAGIVYGVMIEVVQKYYIPNRSFDLLDIGSDGLGCILAYLWCRKYFI